MKLSVLPRISGTINELTYCRLSRKEQTRISRIKRLNSRVGILLNLHPSSQHLKSALSEIRVMIRHVEVWSEEKTKSSTRQHVSDLLSYLEELEILIQIELEQIGILPRLISAVKSLMSFLI